MPQPQEKSSMPDSKPPALHDSEDLQAQQDAYDAAMAKLTPKQRAAMLDDLVALAKKKQGAKK